MQRRGKWGERPSVSGCGPAVGLGGSEGAVCKQSGFGEPVWIERVPLRAAVRSCETFVPVDEVGSSELCTHRGVMKEQHLQRGRWMKIGRGETENMTKAARSSAN